MYKHIQRFNKSQYIYVHIHKAIITIHNTIMMHKHHSVVITNYNI